MLNHAAYVLKSEKNQCVSSKVQDIEKSQAFHDIWPLLLLLISFAVSFKYKFLGPLHPYLPCVSIQKTPGKKSSQFWRNP